MGLGLGSCPAPLGCAGPLPAAPPGCTVRFGVVVLREQLLRALMFWRDPCLRAAGGLTGGARGGRCVLGGHQTPPPPQLGGGQRGMGDRGLLWQPEGRDGAGGCSCCPSIACPKSHGERGFPCPVLRIAEKVWVGEVVGAGQGMSVNVVSSCCWFF